MYLGKNAKLQLPVIRSKWTFKIVLSCEPEF